MYSSYLRLKSEDVAANELFKNKKYVRGQKRKTRFECLEIASKRGYLFNQNAEVILEK